MALRGLCLRRVETVYLSLPLRDSATAEFLPSFEKMHFFFCGIEPDFAGEHRLLMQFLNNQVVNYSAIKMDSQLGCDLLEYVRTNDPFRDFGKK
jgi:serine/threonine-protein kinase RsbW